MGRKQRLKAKRKDPKCSPKPQDIANAIESGNLKRLKKLGNFNADQPLNRGLTPLKLA